MNSKTKSRQERNLESPESDTRSRNRKRTHLYSSDNGMNKYVAGKKKEGCDDRKKHDDREDHDRSRKRRCNKDTILDEDRSAQEKKPRKREEGEEIKKGSRITCHKDENESTYSKTRDSKYERDSKYQNERFDKYDRYWARNDTGSHHEKGSNDHYWSKYPATEGTRSIRPNYWGDSSQDSQSQHIENKSFEDKENERLRDRKSRRGDDSEDTSRDREKKVESDDSAQKGNTDTKHDSQEERVTNNSSTRQKKTVDLLTSRTGGAYIPPAKLRMMQAQITDKSSAAYQRIAWEALKKSVHGHINKVNTGNIAIIVRELPKENIIRGRGLLCRSIIRAQAASPTFTHVYAALVAVINSKECQELMCEGSNQLLGGIAGVAAIKYESALQMIRDNPSANPGVNERVLIYSLCISRIQNSSYESIVKAAEELMGILSEDSNTFPAAYYGLARACEQLKRYENGVKYSEKGLAWLRRGSNVERHNWPGTDSIIPETTRDGLENALNEVLVTCRACPIPDAVCGYLECNKATVSVIPSRNIYCSEPGFSGFVRVVCGLNYEGEFHSMCWKAYKKAAGVRSETEFIGKSYVTEGEELEIKRIVIIGNDGRAITSIEAPGLKANAKAKKEKKRRAGEWEDYRCEPEDDELNLGSLFREDSVLEAGGVKPDGYVSCEPVDEDLNLGYVLIPDLPVEDQGSLRVEGSFSDGFAPPEEVPPPSPPNEEEY